MIVTLDYNNIPPADVAKNGWLFSGFYTKQQGQITLRSNVKKPKGSGKFGTDRYVMPEEIGGVWQVNGHPEWVVTE